MAIQMFVDTLDDVPEPLRDLYTEKDGKFALSVEGVEDAGGLKTALAAERKRAKELDAKVKKWERLGKSDEEISDMIAKAEEAERKKAEGEGDFGKVLQQHQAKWEKDRVTLEAELNAARASERSAVIGTSVMSALNKAGATEEGIDLLPDRLAARIKFETDGGRRVLRIMAPDGETPMAGSGGDGLATFDDLVREATNKWPSLFRGTGTAGSGARGGTAGGKGKSMSRAEFDRLSPRDRTEKLRGGFTVTE